MRTTALALVFLGCSAGAGQSHSTAAPPDNPTPGPAPEPPAELTALAAATGALCECADAACADPAYERLAAAVGERDLRAWTAADRRRFHELRWRGEDCNLVLLTGGDEEVLEHAREALRDRVAGVAPGLLEAAYQKARELHESGAALPPAGAGLTPERGACCGWSDGLCRADPTRWTAAPWSTLEFAVETPQAYSFGYQLRGATEVTFSAVGDIDCDGEYGTFEVRGDVAVQPSGLIRLTRHLE